MEMEQMLASLLKDMKDEISNDSRMNANREADQEHMQEMLARMDTNRNDN
jgi:hypothetical protein